MPYLGKLPKPEPPKIDDKEWPLWLRIIFLWVRKRLGLRWAAAAIIGSVVIYGLANVWWNWEDIKTRPGIHEIFESSLVKAEAGKFNVAVTRLENDDGSNQQQILASIEDTFPVIRAVKFDRLIRSDIGTQSGHDQARELLKETGFDVLIWGENLQQDGKSLFRLHLTRLQDETEPISAGRYQATNDFNLPTLFWRDLTKVLALIIATNNADFSEHNENRIANEVIPYIQRTRELLNSSPSRNWDAETRAGVQASIARSLVALGQQSGGKNYLAEGVGFFRESLSALIDLETPDAIAPVQIELGNALVAMGAMEPNLITDRLKEALANYRKASAFYFDKAPLDWAIAQNNLGTTLVVLGERDANPTILAEAVKVLRNASDKYRQAGMTLNWAATQDNLGNALAAAGSHDSNRTRLLAAESAFRNAIQAYENNNKRQDVLMTQNNLATVLMLLGDRELGPKGLEEVVTIYKHILENDALKASSFSKAQIQNNLGNALAALGRREMPPARLEEAIAVYREALLVRSQENMPRAFARTATNLCITLTVLGQRRSDIQMLNGAIDICRKAESNRNFKEEPLAWAMTQDALGNALSVKGQIELNSQQLKDALTILRKASDARPRKKAALDWAMTQHNIGNSIAALGKLASSKKDLKEAAVVFQRAQEERTFDRVPLEWAITQIAKGKTIYTLGVLESDPKQMEEAKNTINSALAVFRSAGAEYYIQLSEDALRTVQNSLAHAHAQ